MATSLLFGAGDLGTQIGFDLARAGDDVVALRRHADRVSEPLTGVSCDLGAGVDAGSAARKSCSASASTRAVGVCGAGGVFSSTRPPDAQTAVDDTNRARSGAQPSAAIAAGAVPVASTNVAR